DTLRRAANGLIDSDYPLLVRTTRLEDDDRSLSGAVAISPASHRVAAGGGRRSGPGLGSRPTGEAGDLASGSGDPRRWIDLQPRWEAPRRSEWGKRYPGLGHGARHVIIRFYPEGSLGDRRGVQPRRPSPGHGWRRRCADLGPRGHSSISSFLPA